MKIISWNVNGLRAVLKKGFLDFLNTEKPDIICLQEIKIGENLIKKEIPDFPNYCTYYFSATRPGYSGTAIFIKKNLCKDFSVKNGFFHEVFDGEGRVQVLEAEKFFLINAYFPNSRADLSRLDFKTEFNEKMLEFVKDLEKTKPVIVTGDFNVAHKEIDLARPKPNEGKPGYTFEERVSMTKFIENGLVDTFRYLNKEKIQYSWWSYRAAARERNVGWRIDYFCVSDKLKKHLKKAFILDQVKGSDHAPVGIEIYN